LGNGTLMAFTSSRLFLFEMSSLAAPFSEESP
jgi:hypothetical protein